MIANCQKEKKRKTMSRKYNYFPVHNDFTNDTLFKYLFLENENVSILYVKHIQPKSYKIYS
jgi:hypothetical protein